MLPAIVFDDAHPRLAPLTDLRAAFDVRTGALTTLERLERVLGLSIVGLSVPEGLAALTRERHAHSVNALVAPTAVGGLLAGTDGMVLVLNGRWAVARAGVVSPDRDAALVDGVSGALVAGWVSAQAAAALVRDPAALAAKVLHGARRRATLPGPSLLERPWHVRTFRDEALAADLELVRAMPSRAARPGVTVIGDPANTRLHPDASVSPSAVIDGERGAVVVDAHASVRPGAIIVGPAYIGPHATVLERALVKGSSAIGPWCKVAGEVGGTIFQGYANKAHDGHLGDSYVGEWANLGAGTTNSNLLNTYSPILARSAPDAPTERTGETFLGAIIGDHAKFAICTRIMAGSVVHTGTMWAAAAPVAGPVAAFSWVTDQGKRGYRLDKFTEVARAVMKRRGVEPSEAYLERLRILHATNTREGPPDGTISA
jgi:UDP-N-acetylglucosamine diphosphorylase/glucosamine-1-phosphate N-acetyltransferase